MPDGSRHLFFQSADGNLRHAALHIPTGAWKVSESKKLAKNHTLLAVLPSHTLFAFRLFYIDLYGRLATGVFTPDKTAGWEFHVVPLIQSFPISADPKSLSASVVARDECAKGFVLFYENPSEAVMAMEYVYPTFCRDGSMKSSERGTWLNITDAFYTKSQHNGQGLRLFPPRAPFTLDPWRSLWPFFGS